MRQGIPTVTAQSTMVAAGTERTQGGADGSLLLLFFGCHSIVLRCLLWQNLPV